MMVFLAANNVNGTLHIPQELASAMAKMDAMPGDRSWLLHVLCHAWGTGILHLPRHGKVSEERMAREESLWGEGSNSWCNEFHI